MNNINLIPINNTNIPKQPEKKSIPSTQENANGTESRQVTKGVDVYGRALIQTQNSKNKKTPVNSETYANLEMITDERIKKVVNFLIESGKPKSANLLIDAINNINGNYSSIKDCYNNDAKTLKFSKYLKSQGMTLDDLVNGKITEQLRKSLIKKGLSVQILIKDFEKDIKFRKMEEFININPKADISNYLYENYYLKDVANQNIPDNLKDKRDELINRCKKYNQKYNVKIIMSSDISKAYKTLDFVDKELMKWIKASEDTAKLPPILDFSTANANWYDATSAYGKSASGGNSNSSYNGAISINRMSPKALEGTGNRLRHELTHTNDTKRGKNIDEKYDLDEIIPYYIEEKNGKQIRINEPTKGKYYQEFKNAGLSDDKINYAYNNTKEFIAVASEGNLSKYSDEFKQVLIDFGMPEWIFKLDEE